MVAWSISLFLGVKRVQVSWIQGIPNMCSLLVVIILCHSKLGLSYFIHIYGYPFTAFWLLPSPFRKLSITFVAQFSSPPMVRVVLSSITQSFFFHLSSCLSVLLHEFLVHIVDFSSLSSAGSFLGFCHFFVSLPLVHESFDSCSLLFSMRDRGPLLACLEGAGRNVDWDC